MLTTAREELEWLGARAGRGRAVTRWAARVKRAEADTLGGQGGDLRGLHAVARAEALGFGRIVALCHRSFTSYHIH